MEIKITKGENSFVIDSIEDDDLSLLVMLLKEAHIYPMEIKCISQIAETSDEVISIQSKLGFLIQELTNAEEVINNGTI